MMSVPAPLRVALVDDHRLFCDALVALLAPYAGRLRVVGAFQDAPSLFGYLDKADAPDVLLLDVLLPGSSGLDVLQELKARYPRLRVMMLTSVTSADVIEECVRRGAAGFLSKYCDEQELAEAICSVAAGFPYWGKDIAHLLHDVAVARLHPKGAASVQYRLTGREREIVRLSALGLTAAQIADRLFISVRTAETHKHSIFRKLGLHSSVELVHYALVHGLVSL